MYKFKSRVTGDLIMLEPNGRQILEIIGKHQAGAAARGILLPEQMPAAIVALETAVAADEQLRAQALREAQDNGTPPPRFEGISLRQRVMPFVAMVRRCHSAGKEIVWGV
jgi:hypothetical protein